MDKADVLQGFLSKDASKVLKAAQEVVHSVITDREMIEALVPYLEEIRREYKACTMAVRCCPINAL